MCIIILLVTNFVSEKTIFCLLQVFNVIPLTAVAKWIAVFAVINCST